VVTITGLWLPILVSAVLVFVASSIVHMVLRYHATDWDRLPDEEKARAALKGLPVGNYRMPHCTSMADLKDEKFVAKITEGPNAAIIAFPSGPPTMGKQLGLWFVYNVLVGIVAAYVAIPDVTLFVGGMVVGAFLRQVSLAWQASRSAPVLLRVVDRDQVDRLLAERE